MVTVYVKRKDNKGNAWQGPEVHLIGHGIP
jgi:hypothetical protein